MTATSFHAPRLASGVRLRWDQVRERTVLLFPEGAVTLNSTAADVLELCDGKRTLDDIVAELASRYGGADVRPDVENLLGALAARGLVIDDDA
jgi:coenzyme PQQ biosynthesis protein PqqD